METVYVVSDKFKISGKILNTNMVKTLSFKWNGRDITMGLCISYYGEELIQRAKQIIDDYIDKLANECEKEVRLYYWYITIACFGGKSYLQAHGNVTGHSRIQDSVFTNTSEVMSYYIDEESDNMIIKTMNTEYKCPLCYCNFTRQGEYVELITNFDEIKKEYSNRIEKPTIDPGEILLVLSNFDEYYFHSLYCIKRLGEECIEYYGRAHIGTFQDSYLIQSKDGSIDLRYFPHLGNIQFYVEITSGMPLFIQNIGSTPIYVRTSIGVIKLCSGERKKVSKENTETENTYFPDGDLYPAIIMDKG